MLRCLCLRIASVAAAIAITGSIPAEDELRIDLRREGAAEDWIFLDKSARLDNGELILDGRQRISRAILAPQEWTNVTLQANFLVEPQPEGVLACGFVIRARDGRNYYYVHFDRGQAILVRHSTDNEWNEIKRLSNLDKPPGQWHEGKLECHGNTLKVSLNGKLLCEASDDALASGRWSPNVAIDQVIGAYPSLVNLNDGSVLVVYYEEGSGSSIRAKRFRATKQGIEWLP